MRNFVLWAKARLAEGSTLFGAGSVATAVTLAAGVYTGPYVAIVNTVLPLVLSVLGGGAIAATTTKPK